MNPDEGRRERNRYVIFVLTLSYSACALGLMIESLVVGWEPWAIPYLLLSILFAWWIHLKQPFSEKARIYALATVYYSITFYQGVHESSLFDVSLIICFVFFLFSLADDLRVFDIGLIVYFLTVLYQIIVHQGLTVFSDTLTFSRMILHIMIVILSARFAKSMISGRQRTNEMQGRAIGQLAEMNRRTEDFMANISHELRTPINAVTGLSALIIERNGADDEEMMSIYRAGHRLSEQVGDILDYTEIDTGRIILSEEIYEIYSVVNDVISIFRAQNAELTLDLVIDVDASVPCKLKGDPRRLKKILWHLIDNAYKFTKEGGIYVRIMAEKRAYGVNLSIEVSDTGAGILPDELTKISRGYYQADSGRTRSAGGIGLGLSIVYGFVHAMGGFVTISSVPGQGTTVRLSVPQTVVDPSPCMSVADTDKLIIACYLKSEKFKVPLVRDYYEAMINHLVRGLHIPIKRAGSLEDMKKIAEYDKPTHVFTAREEYDEDSAFFLRLAKSTEVIVVADQKYMPPEESRITVLRKPFYGFPIAGILNTLNIGGEIDPLKTEYRVSFPGVRALVVDDEEMNLVVANGIFSGYGMRVQTALSGRESLAMYEKENFDVVFMDHMMPEMDGIEAMKALRQIAQVKNRDTRFVALTANAVSGAREMFFAEGFDGFLPKPIETTELEHILSRILPSAKVRKERLDDASGSRQMPKALTGEPLGIEHCLGDEGFYRNLCSIFVQELPHNMRVFKSAYATGTMEPYTVRLRALRDGAAILGEESLTKQARRLELAIADGDGKRIQKEHMELCTVYTACVQRIRSRLEEGGAQQ
ncbi:MAG: response regulator [Lachnospiraceae bacterium]|nr:response regulator [Lachnospiraceae bacterium]